MNLLRQLRVISGCGLAEGNRALIKFNNSINQANEYLRMRNLAVCIRKSNSEQWQDKDYIDWVKENIEL